MRKPSIKTLERAFPGRGVYLRHLLDNTRAVNENPAVIEWIDDARIDELKINYSRIEVIK